MRRALTGGAWWLDPRAAAVAAIAPTVLTVFICAHELTLHGVLHGVVFTGEGATLGSSVALTHGSLPYSNFPLAQPPGIAIALLPGAFLSHLIAPSLALALTRVFTVAVTVASVYMTALLARQYGIPAAVLAGVFAAVYPFGFFSTGSVTNGPYVLFFTMLGANLAFNGGDVAVGRRVFLAGLSLGFACTIKPWAVLPMVVILVCAAAGGNLRQRLAPAAGGAAVGIIVPCVIFFLAAPGAFWRDVVITELPGHGTATALSKLATVLGLGAPSGLAHPNGTAVVVALAIGAAIIFVLAAGLRTSSAYDYFVGLTGLGLLGAAALPGNMSVTYGDFALPFIAVAVATTTARIITLLAASWSGTASDIRGQIASGLGLIMCVSAVLVTAIAAPQLGGYAASYATQHGFDARAAIDRKVPAGSCAVSNNPALLIAINRFSSGSGACPVVVDPAGEAAIAAANPKVSHPLSDWEGILGASKYLVIQNPPVELPFRHGLGHYFGHNYAVVIRHSRWVLYVHATG